MQFETNKKTDRTVHFARRIYSDTPDKPGPSAYLPQTPQASVIATSILSLHLTLPAIEFALIRM